MKNRHVILLLSLLPLTSPLSYAASDTGSTSASSGNYQVGGGQADGQNSIVIGKGSHASAQSHTAIAIGIANTIDGSVSATSIGS